MFVYAVVDDVVAFVLAVGSGPAVGCCDAADARTRGGMMFVKDGVMIALLLPASVSRSMTRGKDERKRKGWMQGSGIRGRLTNKERMEMLVLRVQTLTQIMTEEGEGNGLTCRRSDADWYVCRRLLPPRSTHKSPIDVRFLLAAE